MRTSVPVLVAYGWLIVLMTCLCQELAHRHQKKKLARAECERIGHRYGEPFSGMGVVHRNCQNCGYQQHQKPDGSWH